MKMYFIKTNLFFLILFFIFKNNYVIGQQVSTTIFIHCELSIDSANKLLEEKQIPFRVLVDTITPQNGSWIDYVIQYYDNEKIREIYRIDGQGECLSEISVITENNNVIYRLLISELIVGFDYFFLILKDPFEYFISDRYNYEDEMYKFDDTKINLKEKYLEIYLLESKRNKKINFKKLG